MIRYFCDFCGLEANEHEELYRLMAKSIKTEENFIDDDEELKYRNNECYFEICVDCAIKIRDKAFSLK